MDTDPRGEFVFGFLQPGEYKLRIFAIGYIPAKTIPFQIEKGTIGSMFLRIEKILGERSEERSKELFKKMMEEGWERPEIEIYWPPAPVN